MLSTVILLISIVFMSGCESGGNNQAHRKPVDLINLSSYDLVFSMTRLEDYDPPSVFDSADEQSDKIRPTPKGDSINVKAGKAVVVDGVYFEHGQESRISYRSSSTGLSGSTMISIEHLSLTITDADLTPAP